MRKVLAGLGLYMTVAAISLLAESVVFGLSVSRAAMVGFVYMPLIALGIVLVMMILAFFIGVIAGD